MDYKMGSKKSSAKTNLVLDRAILNNNSEQSRELIFLHFALKHKNSKELIE